MKIGAGEMERMFHMSANGVRLYEKHGIIHPERCEDNGYRVFDEEDKCAMGSGIQLRRFGFSMPETARLLGGADEQEQLAAMERRASELEKEIEHLRRVRSGLLIAAARAQQAQALLEGCALEEKPAMYFLACRRGEQSVGSPGQLGEWMERYAPHLSDAALLDGPYFLHGDYNREPLSGVAVDAEVALALGLHQNEQVVYLPPKLCVVTAVRFGRRREIGAATERIRRYAREKGLSLFGCGLLRVAQCVREDSGLVATAIIWAPLRQDERVFGSML